MLRNKENRKLATFPDLHEKQAENIEVPDGITVSRLLDTLEIEIDWKITASSTKIYFTLCLNIFLMLFCYAFYREGVYLAIIGLSPFILHHRS